MAAILLQTMLSFYAKISEKVSSFLQLPIKKNIVCKDYCIAHHNEKTYFLPASKYHIVLLGNVQELLNKLDTFCLTYQHVDRLYKLFKYRFSGKVLAKSGQVFDNVQRAVDFNHRNKGVDRMPSIAKKGTLEEKVQKTFVQLLWKDKYNADKLFSFCKKDWKSQKD